LGLLALGVASGFWEEEALLGALPRWEPAVYDAEGWLPCGLEPGFAGNDAGGL